MKKIIGILAFLVSSALFSLVSAQTVSDVAVRQEGNSIVVTYTLGGPSGQVALYVSTDGGRTFTGPLKRVSGDVGSVGAGRHRIVWDVLSEQEKLVGDDIVFEVRAASDHEYVDLGLSVKWATCNVGASKPEDYGDYYAWGETSTKSDYSWSTYKWCYTTMTKYKWRKGSSTTMTKYCTSSECGTVDNKTILEYSDDVAQDQWGGDWRMPTAYEWQELRDNCTWSWTTISGVEGYKVTSRKTGYADKYIFLPATGIREGTIQNNGVGSYGFYWSSSLSAANSGEACNCWFDSDKVFLTGDFDRFFGHTVRPVCE